MTLLCAYLLTALLAHKVLWEVLKRRGRPAAKSVHGVSLWFVKTVKVAILLGILIQTSLPLLASARHDLPAEVFPISTDPFRLRVAGVILYTVGLLTAILGRIQLGESWSDIESPRAADERPVVSHGLYSYIRHPIYCGDMLLLLGLELSLNSWLVLGAVLLIPVVFFRAVKEEKLLAKELSGYDSYVQRTKRFIPFVV
jgi:protein-S-isoprenylcysteine O-methyltransferase Ste14